MAEGSFNLRKWQSNSVALMNKINETEESIKNECQTTEREVEPSLIQEEDETYTKSMIGSGIVTLGRKTVRFGLPRNIYPTTNVFRLESSWT